MDETPVFRGRDKLPTVVPGGGRIGQAPKKGRLSIVSHVIHQRTGENPSDMISRFSRELQTFETGFVREQSVTPDWSEIDTAWLGNSVGHLVVQHIGPLRQQGIPEREEVERINALVVEVGIEIDRVPVEDKKRTMFDPKETAPRIVPYTFLLPRESHNWTPLPNTKYYLRTRKDESRVRIAVYPG